MAFAVALVGLVAAFTISFDPPPVKEGTCIVYIRTANAIWVGTDSLFANAMLNQKHNEFGCKIRHYGPIYFTFAGVLAVEGYYDAAQVASDAAELHRTTDKARDEFVERMIPLFEKSLPVIEKFYPKYYTENIEGRGLAGFVFFEAIFFGFEQGRSVAAYANFRVIRDPGGKVQVVSSPETCPSVTCNAEGVMKQLGKNKAFQPPFNPSLITTGRPVADITKLIELEEQAEPDYVGGHINIIRIDAKGAHWETNYQECMGK